MTTGRQLITAALRKLGANSANAVPTAEDMDVALEALNTLIDSKSNTLLNIHTITPYLFPLTAGQYIYTLGPAGDWVTERPMRVEKMKLLLSNGTELADAEPTTVAPGDEVTFTVTP